MAILFRDLTTLDEYYQVVELEKQIWGPGYDDVVPASILAVSVLRGGVLIGAFDAAEHSPDDAARESGRLVGFVYSIPGLKRGKPLQWSHMLGVIDDFRNDGLGHRLKMLQRERTLAMGLDLIEWTYDPMQALNAHLNFAKLGIIVEEYEVNVYGESKSPLHGGNPTDRFVAEWWIRGDRTHASPHAATEAPRVNRIDRSSQWPRCADIQLDVDARAVGVDIPTGFGDLLKDAPDVALEWRLATRRIFSGYFARGFKAVGFALDRESGQGTYLLVS
jgi:predicted GNAT superfamily acetyltransferase